MSKGRHRRQKAISGKTLALLLAVMMLVGGIVGGTVAWLTAKTDTVTNTFTAGDINIELNETGTDEDNKKEFQMIPGWTIDKDPILTVNAKSEDCYLFIKVEETGGFTAQNGTQYTFDKFIAYAIDTDNWTELGKNYPGVYYCYAKDIEKDRDIKILAGGTYEFGNESYSWKPNQVLVKPDVTKEMMEGVAADGGKLPTLTFTAYASQMYKDNTTPFTAEQAWANVNVQP